ncbi:MAG TPA: hypothetical protein VE990_11605 [Acidimicrobiales bacterium]|nr:hypothetical protein [Acidimicrobiales bacterium]
MSQPDSAESVAGPEAGAVLAPPRLLPPPTAVAAYGARASRWTSPIGTPTWLWNVAAVRLDNPWVSGAIGLVGAMAVVLGRLALASHWDVTTFIGLGTAYSHPAQLPHGLYRLGGEGWDGQYFYRLALDPANLHRTAFGITFDTPYRPQRIGYPVLAWLASAGQAWLVPWSLVAVNVASLGILGLLGGVLARDAGRHVLYGLLLPTYWGYAYSVSWDLSGVSACMFMVAGLLALRRRRPLLAGVLLAAGVLTKETVMVYVAAVALVAVIGVARGERPWRDRASAYAQVAWILPTACFGAWQIFVRVIGDGTGITADTGANLGLPLAAMLREIAHDLATLGSVTSDMDLLQIAVLVAVTVVALSTLRTSRAPLAERVALVGLTVLVGSLSSAVWAGQKDLRSLSELFVMAVIVMLGSRRRMRVPAHLTGYLCFLVALRQVAFL